MLTRGRKLAYSAAAVVLALALIEGAARAVEVWRPPAEVDVGQGFLAGSRVFAPVSARPGFVETAETKRLAFVRQEFSAAKPPGTLRIVALGGSSIRYLDSEFRVLERDLQAALAPRFARVEVVNAGGSSYGSHRLVLVADEILGYEPDVVLVYEANNEFEELQQLHLASLSTAPLQRTVSGSAAVRLVRDLFVSHEAERFQEARKREADLAASAPDVEPTWQYPFTQKDMDERMRAFHDNLSAIVAACRGKGARVLMATMPSNLVRPRLSTSGMHDYAPVWALVAQGKFDEAHTLGRRLLAESAPRHQASDVENGVIRAVAKELSVPLVDAEAAIVAAEPHHMPGEMLFKDYCHLNEQGNAVLRATFEKAFLDVVR